MRKTKSERNFSVHMAGRIREFEEVKMTLSQSGDWIIDRSEDLRLRQLVALEILDRVNENLSLEEVRFFVNLLKVKQAQIAQELGLSESSISKWKMRETVTLTKAESQILRRFFLDIYVAKFSQESHLSVLTINEAVLSIANELLPLEGVTSPMAIFWKATVTTLRRLISDQRLLSSFVLKKMYSDMKMAKSLEILTSESFRMRSLGSLKIEMRHLTGQQFVDDSASKHYIELRNNSKVAGGRQ